MMFATEGEMRKIKADGKRNFLPIPVIWVSRVECLFKSKKLVLNLAIINDNKPKIKTGWLSAFGCKPG